MRKMIAGALALWLAQGGAALALDAPGLLAEWKAAAQSVGATLTYDAEDEGEAGLLVTLLKLRSDSPLPFTLSVPELRMESLPDGRVRILPQSTVTLFWEGPAPFGPGEMRLFPDETEIVLRRSGTLTLYGVVASRLTVEGEFPFNNTGMNLALPNPVSETVAGIVRQTSIWEDVRQTLLVGGTSGKRIAFVQDAGKVTQEATFTTGADAQGAAAAPDRSEQNDVRSEAALLLPADMAWADLIKPETWIDLQKSDLQFVAHNRGGTMQSLSAGNTAANSVDYQTQDLQLRSFAQDIYAGPEGLRVQAEGHGLRVMQTYIDGPPIDLAMEYGRLALALPLIAPDVQEIDLGVDVEDMTFTPETWASFDLEGVLTPLPMDFALHGGLRLRADLPALITVVQEGGSARFRPEVDNVTLRKLAFNGLGIDLQSDGGLAFDMSKTPPLRSGALHTELKGSQNLIAALEAKGFLQGEMLTGLRFVLSGFFKVAGEDHLTSDIKIDEGLLTLNGVKIGGIENLPFPN